MSKKFLKYMRRDPIAVELIQKKMSSEKSLSIESQNHVTKLVEIKVYVAASSDVS